MRERFLKFIGMIIIVVAVGVCLTLMNLRWQKGGDMPPAAVDFPKEQPLLAEASSLSSAAEAGAGAVCGEKEADGRACDTGVRAEGGRAADGEAAGAALQSAKTDGSEREETVSLAETAPGEAASAADGSREGEESEKKEFAAGIFLVEEEKQEKTEETAGTSVEVIVEDGEVYELLISDARDGMSVWAEDYYSHLSDMDGKLSQREAEAAKKTVADQKAAADEALKFWDDELNLVYQAIRASMTEEEFDALRTEERAWLRTRDAAASEAAASVNQSNSAQNLAYTQSLTESTKARVYELAELYYGE